MPCCRSEIPKSGPRYFGGWGGGGGAGCKGGDGGAHPRYQLAGSLVRRRGVFVTHPPAHRPLMTHLQCLKRPFLPVGAHRAVGESEAKNVDSLHFVRRPWATGHSVISCLLGWSWGGDGHAVVWPHRLTVAPSDAPVATGLVSCNSLPSSCQDFPASPLTSLRCEICCIPAEALLFRGLRRY